MVAEFDPPGADALKQYVALARTLGRTPVSYEIPLALYNALLHHFGSSRRARLAARLPPPIYHHRWTQPRVLAELRRLHRRGIRISYQDIVEADREDVAGAVRRYVGSIVRARRLARIPSPPRRVSEGEAWDADRVIEEILKLHRAGKPLAYSKVEKRLLAAGTAYFESWAAAVTAAGIDYETVRLRRAPYSDDELLAILRRLARDRPRMTLGDLHEHTLAPTLLRRFASVEAAAARAGLDGWPVRTVHAPMTPEETIDELRRRHREGGSIYKADLQRDDMRLWNSARRHFGDLAAARTAAGLDGEVPPRRRWTREAILAALARRRRDGLPLHASAVQGEEGGLYAAAVAMFGSYMAVARRFGATPAQRAWTKEAVMAELRLLARTKGAAPLLAPEVPRALLQACHRHFGGYRAARDAAGIAGAPRAGRRRA